MLDHIIPMPKKVIRKNGAFKGAAKVCSRHEGWEMYAQTAAESLSRMFFEDFCIGEGGMELVFCPEIDKGHYRIDSDEGGLKIPLRTRAGCALASRPRCSWWNLKTAR